MSNLQDWSILNKDVEVIEMFTNYCNGELEIEGCSYILLKGTFLQTSKESAQIYLDLDGDGFIFFNKEDLDSITIDPCCYFSIETDIPDNIRLKEKYPNSFKGNPIEWFDNLVQKIYQG